MSSEPIWATGGSPTETIERKKHEGRLSGVFHKVPCWGPSCESRHMTRSFVAPSLRARASSAMPMTLWFWPRDDGFMKHSNSARLSWRARFAPFRSWAWACHLPSLRPLWFFDQHRRGVPPLGLCVNICGEKVQVGLQMKYLGLTSQWIFGPHYELLVPKVTNALCGLLPNIGGAGVEVRQLYEWVIRFRVRAPVWA